MFLIDQLNEVTVDLDGRPRPVWPICVDCKQEAYLKDEVAEWYGLDEVLCTYCARGLSR